MAEMSFKLSMRQLSSLMDMSSQEIVRMPIDNHYPERGIQPEGKNSKGYPEDGPRHCASFIFSSWTKPMDILEAYVG